jgi:effector-binding domain-containing protein
MMKVDFKIKIAPSYKVAYLIRIGGYTGPNMWRAEFSQLLKWSKKQRVRTGRWIMYFIDEWGKKPDSKRRSAACLEIKGGARPEGRIRIMKLPKQKVVSVVFNPDKVADRVVYHGIEGWLQYRPFEEAGPAREVYIGSPWTNRHAWANCEVQVPIKRK